MWPGWVVVLVGRHGQPLCAIEDHEAFGWWISTFGMVFGYDFLDELTIDKKSGSRWKDEMIWPIEPIWYGCQDTQDHFNKQHPIEWQSIMTQWQLWMGQLHSPVDRLVWLQYIKTTSKIGNILAFKHNQWWDSSQYWLGLVILGVYKIRMTCEEESTIDKWVNDTKDSRPYKGWWWGCVRNSRSIHTWIVSLFPFSFLMFIFIYHIYLIFLITADNTKCQTLYSFYMLDAT